MASTHLESGERGGGRKSHNSSGKPDHNADILYSCILEYLSSAPCVMIGGSRKSSCTVDAQSVTRVQMRKSHSEVCTIVLRACDD